MVLRLFSFVFFIIPVCVSAVVFAADNEKAIKYLQKYGYLENVQNESNAAVVKYDDKKLVEAIAKLQEFYNLNVDGKLNEETIALMQKPRCGVYDFDGDVSEFKVSKYKWQNKTIIKWKFFQATHHMNEIASKAFSVWEKHINLSFEKDVINPDIAISMGDASHRCIKHRNETCPWSFVSNYGNVLGHSYFPDNNNNHVEIHLDKSENWYYGFDYPPPSEKISMFLVLVHEVGHALGLQHSGEISAVMSSGYNPEWLNSSQLSVDDINAIQTLYGKKLTPPPPTTTTATKTISTKSSETFDGYGVDEIVKFPDLCRLEKVDAFLVVDGHVFVFYNEWVWRKSLKDTLFKDPTKITSMLKFLPTNFRKITAVYQRPNKEIVLFVGNIMYIIQYPSFKLIGGPKYNPIYRFKTNANITGLVNSYSGRTYIFMDGGDFIEIDECDLEYKSIGTLSQSFPGIPSDIEGVFRYTNGYLYFFKKKKFYEYSEFLNEVIRAGKLDYELFGINCPNESILSQLKVLLNRLLFKPDINF